MKAFATVFLGSLLILFFINSFFKENNSIEAATFQRKPLHEQNNNIYLGAYYFNGWSGKTNKNHLPKKLTDSFSEREPVWGWLTATPSAIQSQIDLAADAGLSFFSFCWYFNPKDREHMNALNQATHLYLTATNKERLKFCLLIVNHKGAEIGPTQWSQFTDSLLPYLKEKQYVRMDGKPVIIFYSLESLVQNFGSELAVKQAFQQLKQRCKEEGIGEIEIAASVSPARKGFALAKALEIEAITGYNYAPIGFIKGKKSAPIDSLIQAHVRVWNACAASQIPYIPCLTLNWDPRPWATANNNYEKSSYYTGYSSKSVYKAVTLLKNWMQQHPESLMSNRMAIVYAWNEYGEGGWLTPGKHSKDNPLDGLKQALKE